MQDADRFLTERELSERFRISPRTLQRWRQTGEGPAFILLGERRIAYSLAEALKWAAARTVRSQAETLAKFIGDGSSRLPSGTAEPERAWPVPEKTGFNPTYRRPARKTGRKSRE